MVFSLITLFVYSRERYVPGYASLAEASKLKKLLMF
jgi:hypothetical protein